MSDIEMTTDDTLELDAIIEEWSDPQSVIQKHNVDSDNYNLKGFKTHTGVFDPQESGTYEFNINGQILSIEVTEANAIPDSVVDNFDSQLYDDTGNTLSDYYTGDLSSASRTTEKSTSGNYSLLLDSGGQIISTSGLNYPSQGDTYKVDFWLPTGNTAIFTLFGVQDADNYYYTNVQDYEQQWQLIKVENGSETSLVDKTGQSIPQDQLASQEIDWGSGGTIECRLYDSTDSLVSTISATDESFTSGGIGFETYKSYDRYWDSARLV
jgi:hypothetical protein